MTDRLGEALARYDVGADDDPERDLIVAAARAWHTLTNDRPGLILRIAAVLARRGSHHPADYTATAKDVVDALTDTTEPDDDLPDVKSRWYGNEITWESLE